MFCTRLSIFILECTVSVYKKVRYTTVCHVTPAAAPHMSCLLHLLTTSFFSCVVLDSDMLHELVAWEQQAIPCMFVFV